MTNPTIKFHPVRENLANVIVNGKESHWYVEKSSTSWYNILWGKLDDLMSFRSQSWFSSQDKQEIKEKLQDSVQYPVEFKHSNRYGRYVYQGRDQRRSKKYFLTSHK